jgi:RHS repeat-associated protein
MHKYCATPRTSARRRHRECVLKCTRNATSNRLLSFDQTLTTTTANVSYQYDANGSLLKDGLRSYEFDAAGRLADVTTGAGIDAPTTRYVHNALGQRLFKTEPLYAPVASGSNPADPGVMAALVSFFTSLWGGNTTTVAPSAAEKLGYSYFYGEDGSLLYELGAGGANSTGSAHYVYLPTPAGPMPIAAYIGNRHYAVHTDHLNTPRRLTQSNKQVAWQWAFSAFGDEQPTLGKNRYVDPTTTPNAGSTTIADVTFNLRYPGQYFDKESGLSYNYFRSYDAKTGRYTQADPIGLDGGWNRFVYVDGNPLLFIDPEGLAGGYVYKRPGVHHQLPSSVARDMEWSPAAVKEFDGSFFNPPLMRQRHDSSADISHMKYNKEVEQFCGDWAKKNKVDPTTASVDDAKKLMYDLRYNSTPTIMNFNRQIWMRSFMQNNLWFRPTE